MDVLQTINPYTEEVIHTYEWMCSSIVHSKIQAAEAARSLWQDTSIEKRVVVLKKLQAVLLEKSLLFATQITHEMGKPIEQAKAEIEKCARLCDYYAREAPAFIQTTLIETPTFLAEKQICPIGLILGVMPWNYPFWQVFRFVIPNLMIGNAIILKHAPNVTGCALLIEKLFESVGFLKHLVTTLIIDIPQVSEVIRHPMIRGVTMTGSASAGRSIAKASGEALKKVVLELGGSDPCLIFQDANLEQAANAVATSRLSNAGQVCISAKRILVHESIEKKFIEKLLNYARTYQYGDPLSSDTRLGPMARSDLRQTLAHQVERMKQQGSECLIGGNIPASETGYFYPATVMRNVLPDSIAYREEIFGPVISISTFSEDDMGVQLANQTPYGLGASIFTQRMAYAKEIAKKLNVGSCAINTYVASDPALAFGGTKESGFGRELGEEGLKEFANIKMVLTSQ